MLIADLVLKFDSDNKSSTSRNIGRTILCLVLFLGSCGGWMLYETYELQTTILNEEQTRKTVLSEDLDKDTGITTTKIQNHTDCLITKVINNPVGIGDTDKIYYRFKDTSCEEAIIKFKKEQNEG